MPLSFDASRIQGLAPDKPSLDAGRKLSAGRNWVLSAATADGAYAWGECMGSGSSPYRVCLDAADGGSKCSCPSRKFPCKHAIGLMFRVSANPADFTVADLPDWIAQWVSRRRGPATAQEAGVPAAKAPIRSAHAAEPEAAPVDPEQDAKAAAARERNRAAREESIAEGLDGLDQWILDRLERGLASFEATAEADCNLISRRLADAKAGALSQRVLEMRARYFSIQRERRNDFVLRELGTLHLLASAYRRQDAIAPGLREDVRRAVGWNVQKADLLADPKAPRVPGSWVVAGVTSALQADGLRRIETWFALTDQGPGDVPRFALLQDFVPASSGAQGSPFVPGEFMEAEFAFYPSAVPLRAVMTARLSSGTPEGGTVHRFPPLAEALADMERRIARQPFAERWPVAAGGVTIAETGDDGPWIVSGTDALRVAGGMEAELVPLLGMTVDVIGIWDGLFLTPLSAQTPIGPWQGGRA